VGDVVFAALPDPELLDVLFMLEQAARGIIKTARSR
jgi:hypothetical protein